MTAGKIDVDAFARDMAKCGVVVRRLDDPMEAAQAACLEKVDPKLLAKLYPDTKGTAKQAQQSDTAKRSSARLPKGSREARQTMAKVRAKRGKVKPQPKETKHDEATDE